MHHLVIVRQMLDLCGNNWTSL